MELKDLLKPPFRYIDFEICDADGPVSDKIGTRQVEFMRFSAAAMNEKYERDFSKPLHWIKKCIYGIYVIFCPKCDFSTSMNGIMDDDFKYCPRCGRKLYPPEK
jgi:hypothetical protein